MSRKSNDLTGKTFGKLTVIKRVASAANGEIQWFCNCDCGNTTIVTSHNLKTQHTKSCGCLKYNNKKVVECKNDFISEGNYIIGVTNDKRTFKIDNEDLHIVNKYNWYINSRGYVVSNNSEFLHRLIMQPSENMVVDHINGDTTDNRKENLRICTQSNNMMNKVKQDNNTSGTIGVNFYKAYNKWRAYITINHKTIHLGYFDSMEDAILQRKNAEKKYFGEYSLNMSRGSDL